MADNKQLKKKNKGTTVEEDVSVQDHAYFKHMLDLIPTHFYFDSETKEKLHAKRSRAADDEKDEDEEIAKSRADWKRAKFDPKAATSVTELQQQLVSEEDASKAKKKKNKNKPQSPGKEMSMSGLTATNDTSSGILSLQQRFQAKLQALKEKRTGLSNKKEETMEKKRLKRKISRLKQKQKQKHQKTPLLNGDDPLKSSIKDAKIKASPAKPLYNKDGNIVFSKFDFTSKGDSKKAEAPTGKNYKQLLEKAEKRKEKAKALKETDKDAAKQLEEKNQWQTVLQKAEGVKIKDDVELLKKSVKRKEKLQKRSKAKWDGRVEKVEQKKKDKQDKRKANIKKKKEGRINKKIKKSKKKGHVIPGF